MVVFQSNPGPHRANHYANYNVLPHSDEEHFGEDVQQQEWLPYTFGIDLVTISN